MTDILVDHPDNWIGVPEDWPNSRWATPEAWANDLTNALSAGWGTPPRGKGSFLRPGQSGAAFRNVMTVIAKSLDRSVASRLYVSVDGWAGPIFIAAMAVMPAGEGMTAEEVASSADVDSVEKPVLGEFTTADGVVGTSCVRYLRQTNPTRVVGRADFIVKLGDKFVDFSHVNEDLADFEVALPRLRELAQTASAMA